MACYHPLLRVENIDKTETAQDGHKYHPAIITKPDDLHERLENLGWHARYKKTIIPCKKCIGCRLDYSRQWANRGYIESLKSDHNYFITLTYDDEHIDEKGNLQPEDLSKFIKDIRNDFQNKLSHKGIKYLACGEYGDKNNRPHYHIILFNTPFPTDTFYEPRTIDGEYYYRNKMIERRWKNGISNITTANWHTIAYVARYVVKKRYGKESSYYEENGIIPEFIRMSKGIGLEYWENNKDKIIKQDAITIKTKKLAQNVKPPNYYMQKLKKENEKLYNEIKSKREQKNNHFQKLKDSTNSYGRLERLEIEERSKLRQSKMLQREL